MTATILAPGACAAELLDELRQLLGRHDGATTLDELGDLADELTGLLRRTRGRIGRMKRQAKPTTEPAEKPEPEPEKPRTECRVAEELSAERVAAIRPDWRPTPDAVKSDPPPPSAAPEPAKAVPVQRPAAPIPAAPTPAASRHQPDLPEQLPRRRFASLQLVLAELWVVGSLRLVRAGRRVAGAMRTAAGWCAGVVRDGRRHLARVRRP